MSKEACVWNLEAVKKLYNEKIENNIFERAHKLIFEENAPRDPDMRELMERSYDGHAYVVKFGGAWWMPTLDKTVYIRLINHPKPNVNYPIVETRDELLNDILKLLYKEKPTYFHRLIIKPLIEVCTKQQIFEIYHGFKYQYSKYCFDVNIALPRDVQLRSKNGHIATIHTHVAVSVGDYLKRIILGEGWRREPQITIPCEDTTLEWFVQSAYMGVFEFHNNIDKIDAVYTLDFLLVVDKEKLFDDCIKHINNVGRY
ncbi:hypothetical protein F-VV10_0253 [Faustovirus]|nr:hypothetical protein F-VV10_0253 [Faustovirus]